MPCIAGTLSSAHFEARSGTCRGPYFDAELRGASCRLTLHALLCCCDSTGACAGGSYACNVMHHVVFAGQRLHPLLVTNPRIQGLTIHHTTLAA